MHRFPLAVKRGTTFGATDPFGYQAVENVVDVHDFHGHVIRDVLTQVSPDPHVNRSVLEGLFSEFDFAEDPAMRPKPDADPELLSRPKSRPWHRSFRSLGRLMTLVALSGLALAAYSERSRPKPSRLGVRNLMLRQRTPGFV